MAVKDLERFGAASGLDLSTMKDISPTGSVLSIYTMLVPGSEAMSTWKTLKSAANETAYWPVIAGSPAEFKARDLQLLLEKLHDIPKFIQQGQDLNISDWLDKAMSKVDFLEQVVDSETGIAMHAALETYSNDVSIAGLQRFEETAKGLGVNPEGWLGGEYTCLHCPEVQVKPNAEDDLIGYKNILTNQPYDQVVMLLVPTKTPWEVAAFLNLGYGNQLHEPHEHFAIHKFWNENYGAEIITSTNDTVEMIISRPPQSAEEAQTLAQQQFVYAPDIVNHGTGKTSALASQLLNGRSWYFWWD
ncbi:MAG: DUF4253 domain-containing protein [Candidatus Melainabacteria bacterium]|nr:DUF4253 domain-containing protein [Candidatus Melainabacteria bacterium]